MQSLLKGIEVIDLSSVLAGPLVSSFLGELGASVLKIEKPGGDVTRSWRTQDENNNDQSAYYSSANWSKSVVNLDLSLPAENGRCQELIKKADVVISNFLPSQAKKLGMTYEKLSAINPELIFCELCGYFGDLNRRAYDAVLQAETGWMSINGNIESGPLKVPVALVDIFASHHMKQAILLALLKKEKTGKGSLIRCSLEASSMSNLANQASNTLMNNTDSVLRGSLHPNIAPYGETFTCRDGKQVILAVGSDSQFQSLCNVLRIPELAADDRFSSNQERVQNRLALGALLSTQIQQWDANELSQELNRLSVPIGVVQQLSQAMKTAEGQHLIIEEVVDGCTTKRITSVPFFIS